MARLTMIAAIAIWPLYFLILMMFWPAWWWFEVHSLDVTDGVPGENFVLLDRTIHRDFVGRYTVEFRDTSNVIVCTASDSLTYRADANLPANINLDWWTNGECADLPPGHYTMSTTWIVQRSLGLDKVITVRTGLFTVHDPSHAETQR